MKNTIQNTSPHLSKFIILFSFLLIAFTVGDGRSDYHVPNNPESIFSCDIDLDGDIDIQTGHSYSSQTQWGGGAFLMNDGLGYYSLYDSIFFEHGYPDVNGDYFDENNYIDIFSRSVTTNPYTINISIIYNYGESHFDSIKEFFIYPDPPVPFITSGDVNGDGFNDMLFAHNNDFLWGIIYNDGTGNFSAPEYFDLDYPPLDIACADLNDDGRSDVIIAGSYIEVYFSTETGFEQSTLGYLLPWSLGGHTLLISDFDNDYDKDVIFYATHYNNHGAVYMYENLGHNEFYEHPYFEFTPFCSYAQIADLNNDSLPDMVFNDSDYLGLHIYYNKGEFQLEFNQFISIDYSAPRGLSLNDFDNNGFNDIATFNANLNPDYFLKVLFNDGNGNFVEYPVGIIEAPNPRFQTPNLHCYPNPFTDKTTISINLNKNEKIKLEIYDIQGKLIRTFIDNKPQAGVYKIIWNGDDLNGKPACQWDGTDEAGREVQAGIYFACISANEKVIQSIKIIKK